MTRESHLPANDASTRERIVLAAKRLFADQGYSETSIKAIARACKMSDAGVFHYFANKREILEAILERPYGRMEALHSDEPVHDERTLDLLVLRTLDSANVSEPILRVLIRQQLVGDPEALAVRDSALANWKDSLRVWFSDYEPDDVEVLVEAFCNGMMGWIFLMQVRHGPRFVELCMDEELRQDAMRNVRLAVPLSRFRRKGEVRHAAGNEAIS